ncbi:CHY zinc finger protein, partial [Streptococcus thermophilus]
MTRKIYGLLVDNESRCQHYHTDLDIVALKCFDCLKYYA